MIGQSYKASGKYTPGSIAVFLAVGLLAGFLLGAAYIYLLGFVSNMLLRSLVIAGYLFAMSGCLILLVRKTRIRNTRVVLLVTLVILLLSYYSNWVFFVNLVQDAWQKGANEVWAYHFQFPLLLKRWWDLLTSPGALFSAIVQILPYGSSSINGEMLKGIPLLIVWIIEFLLVFLVPLYHVVYRASRPYEEDLGIWLPTKEEWTINYLESYREVRNGIRKQDLNPLLEAINEISFYQLQGQESYSIIEFYRKGSYIGPYITITNIKAVQAGPRKLDHRAITVVKMLDIGAELAAELYAKIRKDYEAFEKAKPRFEVTSKQAWTDKLTSFSFNLLRRTKNISLEIKNSTQSPKRKRRRSTEEAKRVNSEERPASIEEITVHVPRVTPEMEKEYLKRKNK